MELSDRTTALIIACIIIWSRWFEISFDRFIEFLTKSFEISTNNEHVHNITLAHMDDANGKQLEIVNNFINNIQLYFVSTYTTNIIYLFLFIGLIIFSSPIKSIRKFRSEHLKSYNYITYIVYLWISVSFLSHFPLLHDLMEIQLSLFPFFLFFTLTIVSIINLSIRIIFQRLFVFHIGPRKRFYELLHSSTFISMLCSMLYGECEYYNYHNSDVCKLLLINIESIQYNKAIILTPVLRIWFTGIAIICINYVIEGIIVDRFIFSSYKSKYIEPPNTHEMVTWFSFSHHTVLLDLIMQLGIFLNRFDRRMLNASLLSSCKPNAKQKEIPDAQQSASSCFTYLKHHKEIWFDFMADCGDGFNSSYEIARLLAQPCLWIDDGDENLTALQRGKVLFIGGDLAYAGPSIENYEKKFFRVFEDAMQAPNYFTRDSMICNKPDVPQSAALSQYEGPTCMIIPGNHDWYDGLNAFHRLICCRSWLGGWLLPQSHSYFSVQLPHNWWIFGVDYGLNQDIDSSQFKYFSEIVDTYFVHGNERVIVISHEPGWIHEDHKHIPYGSNLKYLVEKVIGKKKLKLRLAGDLHNYTRHELMDTEEENIGATLVVSGGGGAFLHPTHCPGKKPLEYHGSTYTRVKEYPSIAISKLYSIMNVFRFREKNLSFEFMGGVIYYSIVFSCYPLCSIKNVDFTDYKGLFTLFATCFADITMEILEESYVSIAVLVFGAVFCFVFTNKYRSTLKSRLITASLHLLAHYIAALFIFILAESLVVAIHELHTDLGGTTTFETFKLHFKNSYKWIHDFDDICGGYGFVIRTVEIVFNFVDITGFHVSLRKEMCCNTIALSRLYRCVYHLTAFLFYFMLAAPWSAFIFGIYLFIAVHCFGKYDEGFSSLRLETYKNFLRFHLKDDGTLTCFVIGVDQVPHRWKLDKKWIENDDKERHTSFLHSNPSKWIPFYSSGDYNMNFAYDYKYVQLIDKWTIN